MVDGRWVWWQASTIGFVVCGFDGSAEGGELPGELVDLGFMERMIAAAIGAAGMVVSKRVKLHWFIALVFLICLTACGGRQPYSGSSSPTPTPSATPTPSPTPRPVAATSYVDCSASANGTGTQSSPWNALASVS